ncbi:putative ribonuclease H-like domain-containing protein [Tanacetum coccineum]|uniref:Ribonuclease H-like domain-containing protein n=1 Tax=Tanacetum coccineum TaxID=301880 RepID=A0ABQ5A7F5_9ASTR
MVPLLQLYQDQLPLKRRHKRKMMLKQGASFKRDLVRNEDTRRLKWTLLKKMNENFSDFKRQDSLDSISNRLQKIVSQLAILGENISQEDLKFKFLRSLPSEWSMHVVVWRNKPDLGTISFDDLYNNFKIVEQEVKRSVTSSSNFKLTKGALWYKLLEVPMKIILVPQFMLSGQSTKLGLSLKEESSIRELVRRLSSMEVILLVMKDKGYMLQCLDGTFCREYKAWWLVMEGKVLDWSFMANEEVPTNLALMAFSDSEIEKLKKDMESNQIKIDKFENASKSLDKLIGGKFPITIEKFPLPEFEGNWSKGGKLGPSRLKNMTGNKSFLTDYQDYDGGYVAFVGSYKGVSHKCVTRKNSVLFTETECLILSPDFKLPVENQVMLKIPRKDNMYSFDLKNVVPSKGNRTNGNVGLETNSIAASWKQMCMIRNHPHFTLLLQVPISPLEYWSESTVNTFSFLLLTVDPGREKNKGMIGVEAMSYELLQFRLLNVGHWNKARLVAQGHRQEEGIDYDEVFAPVARIEAIRLFLAFASFMGFTVYQMDVKSAFLYGTIEEEVYVNQPPGFVDPEFPTRVYKVEKALYGLHQAPRACTEFEQLMHKRFQMSSMGELTFFLGLQVEQRKDGIFLSQDKYVYDILKKFGFSNVKTTSTPMETHKPLLQDTAGTDVDVQPKASHMHAVKRIFRYLKGQPTLGLWYPKDSPMDLIAYSDSDYAGASIDRKSTTGEFIAGFNAVDRFFGSNQLLDYGYNIIKTKIHVDNESAIHVVKNPVYHSKTKHIEIRHHFIRDSYEKKLIEMVKIYKTYCVAGSSYKAFNVCD